MKKFVIATAVCLIAISGCANNGGQENLGETNAGTAEQQTGNIVEGSVADEVVAESAQTEQQEANPNEPDFEIPDGSGFFDLLGDPPVLMQFQPIETGEELVVFHTNHGDITLRLFPDEAPLLVENFLTHARDGYFDGVIFHRVIEDFMIQGGDPLGTGMGGDNIWERRLFAIPMFFPLYGTVMDMEDMFQMFFGQPYGDDLMLDLPSTNLFHFRGALAMAHAGGSMGSQFYIVHSSMPHPMTSAQRDFTLQVLARYGEVPNEFIRHMDEVVQVYERYGGTPHLDWWWEFGLAHPVFGHVVYGMDVVDQIAAVETVAPAEGDFRPVEDVIIESISFIIYE